MTRFLLSLCALAFFVAGCADDGLVGRQAIEADRAGNAPDPTGKIPRQQQTNPLGAGAPPF